MPLQELQGRSHDDEEAPGMSTQGFKTVMANNIRPESTITQPFVNVAYKLGYHQSVILPNEEPSAAVLRVMEKFTKIKFDPNDFVLVSVHEAINGRTVFHFAYKTQVAAASAYIAGTFDGQHSRWTRKS